MKCPICRSSHKKKFQAKHVTALKCSNNQCGHIYALNPKRGQGIESHSDREALFKNYEKRNNDLIRFWHRQNFIVEGCKILDIGAGSGHVLKSLSMNYDHVSITCIEPDIASANNLKQDGYHVVHEISDLDETFDSILLIEVLEHVERPVQLLSALKKLICDKGRIFLTTPCGEIKGFFRPTNAFDNASHIHFFTEQSLGLCVKKAGFPGIDLMTINALQSELTAPPWRYIKNIARPLFNTLFGFSHLTGFIKRT